MFLSQLAGAFIGSSIANSFDDGEGADGGGVTTDDTGGDFGGDFGGGDFGG